MAADARTLPAYSDTLRKPLTQEEIGAYRDRGAAVIRGVLSLAWVERMGRAVDRILANPGSASIEYTPKENPGRYYGDFFVWLRTIHAPCTFPKVMRATTCAALWRCAIWAMTPSSMRVQERSWRTPKYARCFPAARSASKTAMR